VVVAPSWQGNGVGKALTDAALERARRSGVPAVYLLTLTAEAHFAAGGFVTIARDEVPEALRGSAELRGACPETAVVMRLDL
jgi:amino-acid N-acetyltransferase